MLLQMSAKDGRFCKCLPLWVGAYWQLSDVRQRKGCFEALLDSTACPRFLLTIWIFSSS